MTRRTVVAGPGLVKLPSGTSEGEWVSLGATGARVVLMVSKGGQVSQLNQAMHRPSAVLALQVLLELGDKD